jgi:hypothetical protein
MQQYHETLAAMSAARALALLPPLETVHTHTRPSASVKMQLREEVLLVESMMQKVWPSDMGMYACIYSHTWFSECVHV